MTPLDPLAPLRPYFLLLKIGAIGCAALVTFAGGWHFGGRSAEKELAAFKLETEKARLAAQVAVFDRAWELRNTVDEAAVELADSLAEQARTNDRLRAELAEAVRRGSLTKKDPLTNCPSLDAGFVRLWNAATLPGAAPASGAARRGREDVRD
jgi:hypothetical protein